MKLKETTDPALQSQITESILRDLPEWFGIEESLMDYVNGVGGTLFIVAYENDAPTGFISIKNQNAYTAEVYVMGNYKKERNKGIGKLLVKESIKKLKEQGIQFLMVKTLGTSHPDSHYKATRLFYKKVGFYPLEENNVLWGPENPCLTMVMAISTIEPVRSIH